MNDFTKEELETLMYGLAFIEDRSAEIDDLIIIRAKLKSMIEGYCEHENLKDVGKNYRVCRSCGEVLNEEIV